ncbi:MAG TPA: hypothetical protein PK625_00845 [Spirochaetales bacterium]|nr:hypothetical protein [Spirochaetales bacterium]HPE35668.1 hypothetical protein [Spirochaetales bacterium]
MDAVFAVDSQEDLDTEQAAFELFPLLASAGNAVLRAEYAIALADLIGSPGEFHKYVRGNSGDLETRRTRLLTVFRDNILLLVGKTWVDHHDEKRRDAAIKLVDELWDLSRAGQWATALSRFRSLSADLAWLLFGESPLDRGFMDYVFRIDPKLGIFYWYVDALGQQDQPEPDLARLEFLIGIYALSSF